MWIRTRCARMKVFVEIIFNGWQDLNKSLKHIHLPIWLHTCAHISELPSNISNIDQRFQYETVHSDPYNIMNILKSIGSRSFFRGMILELKSRAFENIAFTLMDLLVKLWYDIGVERMNIRNVDTIKGLYRSIDPLRKELKTERV